MNRTRAIAGLLALGVTASCGGAGVTGDDDSMNASPDASVGDAAVAGVPAFAALSTTDVGTGLYNLRAIGGTSNTSVWTVTDYASLSYGRIGHFDGSSWLDVGSSDGFYGLFGVYAASPTDVWAVGGAVVGSGVAARLHWNGSSWSSEETSAAGYYTDVDGASSSSVFAVTSAGALARFNGTAWSDLVTDGGQFSAVVAISATEALVLEAGGKVRRWNGTSLDTGLPSPGVDVYTAMWATSASNIYTVTTGGVIAHYDGTSWTKSQVASGPLDDIFGTGPADIWTVGHDGEVWHFDGASWRAAKVPVTSYLRGVWASGPKDVWVVGDSGTTLHYTGQTVPQ